MKNTEIMIVWGTEDYCYNKALCFEGTYAQAQAYAKRMNFGGGVELNKETKSMKSLKFTCPVCKNHILECVQEGTHSCEVKEIFKNGDFSYGPIQSEADVDHWQCLICGYTPMIGDSYMVDNLHIAQWIERNCPQD